MHALNGFAIIGDFSFEFIGEQLTLLKEMYYLLFIFNCWQSLSMSGVCFVINGNTG